MAARKPAIDKPTGVWDDIVYPIARRVTKGLVKSKVITNTTRVKANRAILDKAYIAQKAKTTTKPHRGTKKDAAASSLKADRYLKKQYNRSQRYSRISEGLSQREKAMTGYRSQGTLPFSPKVQDAGPLHSKKTVAVGSSYAKKNRPETIDKFSSGRSAFQSKISTVKPNNVAKGARRAGVVGGAAAGGFAAGRGNNVPKQKPKPKPSPKGRGGSTKKK